MKDDNMQNFSKQGQGDTAPENASKSPFDTKPQFSEKSEEELIEEVMAQARKERVKNFSVHMDDENEQPESAKPAQSKPEESKDIYSFSEDAAQPRRRAADENPPRRYTADERRAGVDISAGGRAKPQTARADYEEEPEEPEEAPQKWPGAKSRHKKGGGCLRGIMVATVIMVCSIFLSWYIVSCVNDLLGLMKTEDAVVVNIPENATTDDVAKIFKDKGLVDQELFFKIFTNFKYRKEKKYTGYIAGEYELNGKMGYEGMVNKVKYPVETDRTVMLTFPEGLCLTDIAKKLEENNVCPAADFIKAVNEGEYDYRLIKAIPDDGRFFKLEGYIFPDTYEFYVNEGAKSVVNRFVQNAQRRIGNDLLSRANEIGMTMDQVLTLASIIQKEASDPNEMGKVSSVFHNRLNKSGTFPNLQSDPTINYVENSIVPLLTDPSQKEKYAQLYNTYKCVGLPVAPICSPGLEAIRAALYPEKTGYYFFVTDKNDKYYYARTNSEHEANIAAADRVNERIDAEAEQAVAAN